MARSNCSTVELDVETFSLFPSIESKLLPENTGLVANRGLSAAAALLDTRIASSTSFYYIDRALLAPPGREENRT